MRLPLVKMLIAVAVLCGVVQALPAEAAKKRDGSGKAAKKAKKKGGAPPEFLLVKNEHAAYCAELETLPGIGKYSDQTLREYKETVLDILRHKLQPLPRKVFDQAFSTEALIKDSDRDPADVALRRTRALLADLGSNAWNRDFQSLEKRTLKVPVSGKAARLQLFADIVALRRKAAFSNPLVREIESLLFIKREAFPFAEKQGSHMCDQYFGFHATQGGTVKSTFCALDKPFSNKPTVRNLLENSIVQQGRLKGQQLTDGAFLAPEVSFDGNTLLFCYTEGDPTRYEWTERSTYHIFKCSADGSGLVQLTDGCVNDIDPCFLPNGRIVFISERRGGYGRCHGRPVPSYTLHSMHDDGTDIVALSPHETNEWHPSIDHNGMIVYTRWDYVDRGHSQAHHPWITYPDGRDARAIHGNTSASREDRANMEMNVRAIPGSHRYIATAAPHHGEARGSLVMFDPRIEDDDRYAPITRITPEHLFPETEYKARHSRQSGSYATPWPLSEKYYICVYDHAGNAAYGPIPDAAVRNYGIYLVDVFGNKELIYRDPSVSCLDPMPLQARKKPPVIPHQTLVGRPRNPDGSKPEIIPADKLPKTATVGVMNVYDSLRPYPEGMKVTHLRIWQLLPKSTPLANKPRIGYGSQKGAKKLLGIVPVEEDGSAFWNQPVNVPVLYHAIDAKGMAIQGMRSATYVHPGEKLMCNGCHERRVTTPKRAKTPIAMRRAPSDIQPEFDGTNPFSFPRLVQPVLDQYCVDCHQKNPEKAPDLSPGNFRKAKYPIYTSFMNLKKYAWFYDNAAWVEANTIPGQFGARMAPLYQMLAKGHHDVKLPKDDMLRLTIWLDSNGLFFGHETDLLAQAEGKVVQPSLE